MHHPKFPAKRKYTEFRHKPTPNHNKLSVVNPSPPHHPTYFAQYHTAKKYLSDSRQRHTNTLPVPPQFCLHNAPPPEYPLGSTKYCSQYHNYKNLPCYIPAGCTTCCWY